MQDAFAIFDLSHHPWLDEDKLREEYHRRSATTHPDVGGDAEEFIKLHRAYRTIRHPDDRLRHLLELEAPELLAQTRPIPPALADQFMKIGAARKSCLTFLAKYRAATSPLARALCAGEINAQRLAVSKIRDSLASGQAHALARIAAFGANWRDHLSEVATVHDELSYLSKWSKEMHELSLELSIASDPI